MMSYLIDVLFLVGVGLISAGVYLLFGIGWCFVITGAILSALATFAAMRRNDTNTLVKPDNTESIETE